MLGTDSRAFPKIRTTGIKVPPHLAAVLMLGILSQVGQVLLLREFFMVFHGNEFSIGLILAAWLAWTGVGSRLGAALAERYSQPLPLLLISAVGILLSLPLTIILIRLLRGFFDLGPGAYLSPLNITISCFLLMAPTCLMLGVQFVLLAGVWRRADCSVDTSGAGKTYVGEAAGNMLGGLLFTFILVKYFNSFQVALAAGLAMLGAVLYAMRKTAPGRKTKAEWGLAAILILALAAALSPLPERLDRWAYHRQWHIFSPRHELVETRQSKHGNIAILRLEEQYSFYQSGHLVFSTAGPEAPVPGMEEQEAVILAHMALTQHKKPGRVLLIGGGLSGALGEIIKHPVERVDYIELDEALTEASRPYISATTLEALNDPRVNLIHTDGRLFVKASAERYDLILVDAPDPATAVLNRYYSREFFSESAAMLKPGGVLVIGAVSTPDLRGSAVANRNTSIYHTLNSVFERVLPAGDRHLLYFATNSPEQVSVDPAVLQERYTAREIQSESFSAHHFHTLLEDTQLRRVNWVIRNHGRSSDAHVEGPVTAPISPLPVSEQELAEVELPPVENRYFINSDFKPIGYFYTLMFWDELTRGGRGETFRWLLYLEAWWAAPLFMIPILAAAGLRLFFKPAGKKSLVNFAILFTVFTTGLSTMALQIALLFSFQSIYGFIYETVGLIVALFMFGLALGAFLTHRYVKNKASIDTLALVQLLIAALAIFIAIVLPPAAAVHSAALIFFFFSLLTFTAGLINGVDFPLSMACYLAHSGRADKTAGIVYGMELFGATAGAALASAVIAPVLGIIACCLFAAIANGAAFIVLLISRGVEPCLNKATTGPG